MRLLVDARPIIDPARGGVGRVALALVNAYAETFAEDQIVCVTTGSMRPELPKTLADRKNVTHLHIRIPNKLWSTLCILGFVSLTREAERRVGKIDAAFFPNLGFIGRDEQGGHIGPPLRRTLLLHDLSFLIEPRWFTWKQRLWHRALRADRMIRSFPHLLAVSETTKRDAIRLLNIPEERITVIPIGPTLVGAQFIAPIRHVGMPTEGVMNHAPTRYILALGGDDPRKNIATAKVAVALLREDTMFKDIELLIPDTRPTDEELASLYQNAAAFLYPSWYEGYGLPLHEAAQFGTPCIASTSGALPETAPPGTLFANPAKPHHWVEALRIALTSPRPVPTTLNPSLWTQAAKILKSTITG